MSKTTLVSIVGLSVVVALLVGCGTVGLAVKTGMVREQMIAFPPNSRYQLIVRIGTDALPWEPQSDRSTAINMWVHGRGTIWHIVKLIRVPLGKPVEQQQTKRAAHFTHY